MYKLKKWHVAVAVLAAIVLVGTGFFLEHEESRALWIARHTNNYSEISLVAVGDDLVHSEVYDACETDDGYDFNPVFSKVRDAVESADIAAINQETIMVDGDYSSFPAFGSPYEVADATAGAGFDLVTHATNHAMDRGADAVRGTLKYWEGKHPDVTVLGIHDDEDDAAQVSVVERDGIRVAMLNYTYDLNGFELPEGEDYLVDLLTDERRGQIARDIEQAEDAADFTVVFAHWGTEYESVPDESQREWSQFFADNGVDLVIGTHPHVLEPVEEIEGEGGNRMVCYYSLGNFVSDQDTVQCMLGGMAKVVIRKGRGDARIKSYSLEPLVTHIGAGKVSYTTYRLSDYSDKLGAEHHLAVNSGADLSVETLQNLFDSIV